MTNQPGARPETGLEVAESLEERNIRCTLAVKNLLKSKLGDAETLSDEDLAKYDKELWMEQNPTSLGMPPTSFRIAFYYTEGGLEKGVLWENRIENLADCIKKQRVTQEASIRPIIKRVLGEGTPDA